MLGLAALLSGGCEGSGGAGDTAGASQALLAGPLAGATVEAFLLDGAVEPIESTVTQGGVDPGIAGTFDLSLAGVADDELILVTATGGTDLGSGGATTPNSGTLYGLAPASTWRTGGRVNALTDVFWRYCQDWRGEVSPPAFSDRLGQVAVVLVSQDLDGGGIGVTDLVAIDPRSMSSDEVNFDYARLFEADGYAATIRANGLDAELREALGELFGPDMGFSPPVQMEEETKLVLTVFGGGSMVLESQDAGVALRTGTDENLLAAGEVLLDAVDEDAGDQRNLFFARGAEQITIRAVPLGDAYPLEDRTQVLSWDGCDVVSADQSLCTVGLQANRVVTANFGNRQTTLAAGTEFIDLSDRAETALIYWDTTVEPAQAQLEVLVDVLDADLLARMEDLASSAGVTWFLAGVDASPGGAPFLLKVNGVLAHDANHWVLSAEEAALGDFIEQGTGLVERTMYPEDLVESPSAALQALPLSSKTALDGQPMAHLVPSSDPGDPTFHVILGPPPAGPEKSTSATKIGSGGFTIYGPNGTSLTVSGSIDVTVAVEAGVHFKGFLGLKGVKSFKFIPKLSVRPQLTVTGDLTSSFQKELLLLRMEFARIKFMVGPVPVWITPTVDLVLGTDGRLSASVTTGVAYDMSVRGGVRYRRGKGVSLVKESSVGKSFNTPVLVGNANLRAYVSVEPTLFIYDLMGPGLKIQPGLGLAASLVANLASPQCYDMSFALVGSVDGKFTWSMEGKLAKLLGLKKVADKVPDFQIFHWATDLARRQYNPCSDSPSALKVIGETAELVMVEGTDRDTTASYTVRNDNVSPGYGMPWTVAVLPDVGKVIVAKRTGQLAAGAQEVDDVQIINTASLAPGTHATRLVFTNTSTQPSATPRKVEKFIRVKVIEQLAAPVITQGVRTAPEVVSVDWLYGGNVEYLDGFNLFRAVRVDGVCPPSGPDGWEKAGWADRSQRSASASVPYGNYCMAVEAVGKPGSGLHAYSQPYLTVGVDCDLDGDGYDSGTLPGCGGNDCCDDGSGSSLGCSPALAAAINPGVVENNFTANCEDGVDNNCDGEDSFCAYGKAEPRDESLMACTPTDCR